MYKEVAIDPACLADFSYYGLIKTEFGFEKGRYISAVIKRWAREAYPFVKMSDMTTVRKKSVTNFLNKLVKSRSHELFCLAKSRRGIQQIEAWEDWWIKQSEVLAYPVTISARGYAGTIDHMAIINGNDSWKIKPTVQVERDPIKIIDIIEPLLRLGTRLQIVDQYFSFSSNNTLVELIQRLSLVDASIGSIHLVTSIKTANAEAVYDEYKSIMPAGLHLKVTEIPEKYIHDRYFITEIGALKAGHGWKPGSRLGSPSDKLSVNISSVDELATIKQGLEDAYNNGTAIDIFEITKS